MPGAKPHLHLPYISWPVSDRLLWERAFCQEGDPFADTHLSKASCDRCMWSWRRYLGFVANNEPEALEIAPAQRLTIDRVKRFVAHISKTNAPNSVVAVVEGLYTAARIIMPDRDWSWLKAIKSRLQAAAPARSPVGPIVTSVPLLEHGLKLMEDNKPEPATKLDVNQFVAYRDGLMISLVAYVPIRPKNLASLEIDRHLILVGDRWFIIVPREETKTGKRIQFEIPEVLIPYLTVYLSAVRPATLRGRTHKALWVNRSGGTLSYVGIVKSFARLSIGLGVRISPHEVRNAAVATWAIARPDQIGVASDLLYHSRPDTTHLYNRVAGIEASRVYGRVISEIRKKQTIRD